MSMSVATIVVEVVPPDGTAAWTDPTAGSGYRSFQSTPPEIFGDWQKGPQPIWIGHGGPQIGRLTYLEHDLGHGNGGMYGVGVVHGVPADMIDGLVMCSAEIWADAAARTVDTNVWENRSTSSSPHWTPRPSTELVGDMYATHARLDGVALVERTASLTSVRVRAYDVDYLDPADRARHDLHRLPAIVHRAIAAATYETRSRHATQVRIHRPHLDRAELAWRATGTTGTGQYGVFDGQVLEIEHHGGGYILSVS